MPRPLLVLIYIAVTVISAVVVIIAFNYILPILVPFLIAFVFSVLMEPIIRVLEQKARFSRGPATMAAMVLFFGGIAVVFSVLVLQLVAELIQLSLSLPAAAAEFRNYYQVFIEKITAFYISLPPGVISSIEQNISTLTDSLQGLVSRMANSLMMFVSLVPGTLTVLVVSIIATYFLARDRYLIIKFLMRVFPSPWGEKAVAVIQDMSAAFIGYLRAQAVLVLITTVLSVTGLYLIGAKYALTIGLLVGFFDLIPVLGPATVYIPWVIWSFVTGATAFGVKIAVLYLIVLLTRQFLETKIVSANLGLHPLATLIAMYAGLKTMGISGLIMGPVLLIALQSIVKTVFFTSKGK
ncbi:predicted permease [Pelotomaculum thermopropionicum SI]|uniref:Predicted permease n=1 Tax=Pelotomaculum thermopropionicum (strain DSM 13744 / JCM 10971 / SI) TaxID=370438 RepID=A5D2U2_PELTS|nr:predicted permease [Pelotomaculum thermopropionicum SI]